MNIWPLARLPVYPSPTTDLSPLIAIFLFRRTEEASADQATAIMPTFPQLVRPPATSSRREVGITGRPASWTTHLGKVCGNALAMVFSNPARPSQQVIRMSWTPRFVSTALTERQNPAPSPAADGLEMYIQGRSRVTTPAR